MSVYERHLEYIGAACQNVVRKHVPIGKWQYYDFGIAYDESLWPLQFERTCLRSASVRLGVVLMLISS